MSDARTRINVLLLVLLSILGALALWGPAPEREAPAEQPRLTPMTADQVRHILVQRPDLPGPIRLDRNDGNWQVLVPGRERPLPADAFKADELAGLAEAQVHDRFPAGEDLSPYGLDRPLARLRLNAVELAFGGTEPLRHRRYVLIDGQVALINDIAYDAVSARPEAFVSRALLPGEPELAALRLPGLTVRHGDQGWTVEPPDERLGGDALQSFVDAWRYARALSVHLPETAPKGEGEVVLTLADGSERRFLITARKPRLRLWDPQRRVEYEFAAYTGERLMDPARHLPPEGDGDGGAEPDDGAA